MPRDSASLASFRRAVNRNFAGNWGPLPLTPQTAAIDVDLSDLVRTLAAPPATKQAWGTETSRKMYFGQTEIYTQGVAVGAGANHQRAFARYNYPVSIDRIDVQLTALTAANTVATLRVFSAGQYWDDPTGPTIDAANGWTPITEQDYYNSLGDLTLSFHSPAEQTRTLLPAKLLTDPQNSLAWNIDNGGASAIRIAITVHARRIHGDPVETPAFAPGSLEAKTYSTPRPAAPRPAAQPPLPKAVTVSILQGGRPLSSRTIPWAALDAALKAMVLTNTFNGTYDPTLVPIY